MKQASIGFLMVCSLWLGCTPKPLNNPPTMVSMDTPVNTLPDSAQATDTITLGAGCFWCVEAVFQDIQGVQKVVSGYMGGHVEKPSYKQVCTGQTGHAEVCQVIYNPAQVSLETLLEAFWLTHDPTTLNRQGADVGTQYRSAIFYHNPAQQQTATTLKNELDRSGAWQLPIVTEVSPASTFYPAEDYHQNYYNENGETSYCQYVIKPKLDKFHKVFKDRLKTSK